METWEIIVLIVFLILLAVTVGLGIYFAVKYENDQKKKNQGPTAPTGPTGPTGATGIAPPIPSPVGPTGITGSTGGMLTRFSISPQSNPNLYMSFIPASSPDNPRVIVSNGSELLCTDYEWLIVNNGVNPSLLAVIADPNAARNWMSPINITNSDNNSFIGSAVLANNGLFPESPNPGTSGILNWQYTADKRWCGIGALSQYCLYHNSDNTVSVETYRSDPNFLWNVVPRINTPICSP